MGTPGGLDTLRMESKDVSETKSEELSALGESFDVTPMVLPVRGHLDSIKRLLKGDLYIGRGSKQRCLAKSRCCNTFEVSQHGRAAAIAGIQVALSRIGNSTSPDEGAGCHGRGEPMKVGVGYTQRALCDGQSLASPVR